MLHVSFERRLIFVVSALLAAGAILGIALSPALSDQVRPLLQSLGIISCTSTGPCQEGKNAGAGAGLEGISAKGSGVIGRTTFNSTPASGGHAAVLGQDKSTSGTFDFGVYGNSPAGTGVEGSSFSGPGVQAISVTSNGVVAQSTNGAALLANSANADGIGGFTSHDSMTSGVGRSGLFASDSSTDGGHLNWGVRGSSTYGIGVEGVSSKWVGVNAVGGGFSSDGIPYPALSIVGNGIVGNADLLDACSGDNPPPPNPPANPCNSFDAVFTIRPNGYIISTGSYDIQGSGSYQKNGGCVAGCSVATATSAGRAVTTYASMASQPTIEDFGEAQLVNGQTYVHLDSKFANVVDQRATYLVFITPEGDANVLYVTQKTAGGFAVRESHGGRSTIAFNYRIVAKPFGSHEARLPMVEMPRLRDGRLSHPRPHD